MCDKSYSWDFLTVFFQHFFLISRVKWNNHYHETDNNDDGEENDESQDIDDEKEI